MKRARQYAVIIAYCLILMLNTAALRVNAEDSLERQFSILFISSYGFSSAGVPEQLQGFEDGIEGLNYKINYEFMDAERFYASTDISNFDKYLRYKIFTVRDYDLVVVADDPALRYAINNRSKLFADIPMVFMGINNITEAVTASAMKNATGLAENQDFSGNYELMRQLFPDRDRVVVIIDSTVTGQGDYVEFMKFREKRPEMNSKVINTSYYTKNGLKEALGALGDDDIILFLDFSVDGERNSYSLENASEFISTYARGIPVFRLSTSNVGHGVLGGISYSFYESGKAAGNAAKEILTGKDADEVEIKTATMTTPYFEQSKIDEFGLRYSQLPPGTVIINERESIGKFYRENKTISNLVIIIALLMILIIFLMYKTNTRRKIMIRTDFLTQMPNRKKIMEDIGQVVDTKTPYGLIMIDVDHFKGINDTYGHKVGDEIISQVAGRLQSMADKDLIFARLGGDEFIALFYRPSDAKARDICEEIMDKMAYKFGTSAGTLYLTVSMGAAMYPKDVDNPEKLMEYADKALYRTKENGRNGYTLFDSIDKS